MKRDDIALACRFARRARGAATRYVRYLETAKPPQTFLHTEPEPEPAEPAEPPEPAEPD